MCILNLTPHEINILRKDCTVQQRNNKIFLNQAVSLDDAILMNIPPEPKPLNITINEMTNFFYSGVPLLSYVDTAEDNYSLKAYFLNDNSGNRSFPDISKLQAAEMIIISQRCANYINTIISRIQFGQPNDIEKLILLDKFYTPFNVVYPNRAPDSSSQGFSSRKPIGALGLLKVTAYLRLDVYATAIRNGFKVSLHGLDCAAQAYTNNRPNFSDAYEQCLQVANDYLRQCGLQPYPLFPRW